MSPRRHRRPKHFRVSSPGGQWLHAKSPCEPLKAHLVQSEWVADEARATVFDSYTYAETVAQCAPPLWRIKRQTEGVQDDGNSE